MTEINGGAIAYDLEIVLKERDQLREVNAALWVFIRAQEAVDRGINSFDLHDAQVDALRGARRALAQYEQE